LLMFAVGTDVLTYIRTLKVLLDLCAIRVYPAFVLAKLIRWNAFVRLKAAYTSITVSTKMTTTARHQIAAFTRNTTNRAMLIIDQTPVKQLAHILKPPLEHEMRFR
jgi:hypothetical protein